jgi:hypothetical protein
VAYIGNQPIIGNWRKLDDISGSFNGSTTSFTTAVDGENVTAATANQLILSLGGVIQEPGVDFTVTTNSVIFTTAPASGLSFFGIYAGDSLNLAGPSDDTVDTASLVDGAVTSAKIANDAVTSDKIANDAVTSDKIASGVQLTDPSIVGTILEDVYTITDGAAFEVDPSNGSVQLITLGANRTPKATNFAAGESITLMVDDGTAYTLTWTDATWGGSGVVWTGGSAPTLATTGYTTIQFWKVGSQVYGAYVGDVA